MSEAVAEALALLPTWVRWTPLLLAGPATFVGAAGLVATAGAVGSRAFDRLPADAHWTLRARALWGARQSAGVSLVAVLSLAFAWLLLARGPTTAARWPLAAVAVVAVVAGGAVGLRGIRRRLGWGPLPWREAARRTVGFRLAMYAHGYGVIALAFVLPRQGVGWAVAGALAALAMVVAGFLGLPLEAGRALGLVDAPDDRLRRIVAEASARAGVPTPRTFVVPSWVLNAAAYPPGQRLFFTSRAVEALDDDALRAVAAHELAHLTESRGVQLARMSGALVLGPLVLLPRALDAGLDALALLLGAALAALVISLLVRRLARRMEERADAHAHDDPAYPAALERMYALNLVPAVLGGRRPHPELYDRLVSAGAPPDWPRPSPPPRLQGFDLVVWSGLVGAAALAVCGGALLGGAGSVSGARLALALGRGSADTFSVLAEARFADGDLPQARTFAAAAAALEPWNVGWAADEAVYAAVAGDCAAAVQALRRASALEAGEEEGGPVAPAVEVADATILVRLCLDDGGMAIPPVPEQR